MQIWIDADAYQRNRVPRPRAAETVGLLMAKNSLT